GAPRRRGRPRRPRPRTAPGPADAARTRAYRKCMPCSTTAVYRAAAAGGTVRPMSSPASAPPVRRASRGPGVVLALAVAAGSMLLSSALPGVSALIIAVLLGIVVANVTALPAALTPGTAFAAKKLLRAGIVLLGLQVVLG